MNSDQHILEQQICTLSDQLDRLNQRVTLLETALSAGTTPLAQRSRPPSATAAEKTDQEPSLLIDSSSLLKHISILCFLLVAALGLRALTDNGILNPHIGSILGISYATGLIIGGHFFYRSANTLAPVFAITGALLMFSVVVETHARFASLPEGLVYIMLAATGIGMAFISYHHKVALPIIIGTLGMCFAAVAIDYPTPYFPYLILILWVSNILGFFATRLKRCSWLRWILLFITHAVLQTWGLKISGIMAHGQQRAELAPGLFIPMVVVIGITFTAIALLGIIRSGNENISKFDFSLPTVNAAWCYVAGIYALKNPAAFGSPAAIAAIVYFALAYWLSRRQTSHAQGTNTFTAGGLILSCLSLPALFGSMLLPLPILSILAIVTCFFSNRWSSGGMRLSSYLLQGYISAVFVFEFIWGMTDQRQSPAILFVTLTCGVIAVGHYYYARHSKPPKHSRIFSHYDKRDQSALLPLLAGLTNLFFASILLAYYALQHYYPSREAMAFALTATQSMIINLAATFLMVRAFFNDNVELRNVSILVLMIGGCKVFLIDMFQISGTWLVCSIFTFGIAAALASLVLARWKVVAVNTATKAENSAVVDNGTGSVDPET